MKHLIILVALALLGCENTFDVGKYETSYMNGMFYCNRHNGIAKNERLALCETAIDCRKVCDEARKKYHGE